MIKIELKNIKHAEFASEETNCYTATLYVDGVAWGTVGNDGHGGSDYFHGSKGRSYGDLKALDERIAAEYPAVDMTDLGISEPFPESLEGLCGDIVNAFLAERTLKRTMAKKLVFFQDADKVAGAPLYEVALKGHPADKVAAIMAKKYPKMVALNIKPLAEAVELFRKAG